MGKKILKSGATWISLTTGMLLMIVMFGGFNDRISPAQITADLNLQADAQQSTVLLNNASNTIPLINLKDRKIASINIGLPYAQPFNAVLRNYAPVTEFELAKATLANLESYTTVIVQVNAESLAYPETVSYIMSLQQEKEVILVGYGNTFALKLLSSFTDPIIWNPETSMAVADFSAQLIFGGTTAQNRLKEAISDVYPAGAGYTTEKIRLRYSTPEDVGINSSNLNKIDRIVNEAISQHATPSAVVMVVKNGNVIFNRAYGSHTYGGEEPTKTDDIYDLASVTKTAATTIAVMRLYEQQKLDLNAGIGSYFPEAKLTNKEFIPLKEVMLHQAGFINLDFPSYMKSQDHSPDSSYAYPVKVADNYFVRRNYYQEAMLPKMLNSPIKTRGQYVYSDISMYMMKEVVEHQAGKPLDQYVLNEFYAPLGMRTAGFNPRQRFGREKIVPTEQDNYFRKTLLQGYVHDQGAALVSGVSGHAGLFASANDLAILNQVLLNGGKYGGVEYFKPETVDLFTSRQSGVSRRGLGFDRGDGGTYPSSLASAGTYGHTGYTGTCVWVDPKNDLIYIFLSNRINPSVSNKLNTLRIRPRIQDAIYEAISKGIDYQVSSEE
ncbi:serine hydrolase domain-containing protein [Daejeonella lutea]|uniref:CubicO group peptidase, beta-lactamase class C family n=1 Tax=Daejeonella lutea TaxID=572036 RepID=A0A1T5ARE7_9SPHI|nr:serine hydrolase [Daejeonella lutea]SKB37604.1 CubicO group peptidase, beta-lactamase class C family [Daejeonella lutea]